MMKNILNDYRCGIRQGFKNMRDSDASIFLLSMFISQSQFMHGTTEVNDGRKIAFCYVVFNIFLIILLIAQMYPNRLNKMLQLCPLTTSEKEQYLKLSYRIKTGLPILLYSIALPFFVINRVYSAGVYIAILVITATFSVSVNIYRLPVSNYENKHDKKHQVKRSDMPEGCLVFRILAIFSTCLSYGLIFDFSQYSGKISGTGHILTIAIVIVVNILICVKMLVSYYNVMIKSALNEYKC